MEIINAQGVDHYIQRLYVHWDITTMCQYKCSYCYAIKQYGYRWGHPSVWNKQLYIIDELSKSTLPVFLGFLGGEPTLHHRYKELLQMVMDKVITHDDSKLYITTNGARGYEWFKNHPDSNGKINMLFSLHPEYVNDARFEDMYRTLILMNDKGYKVKMNLVLHPDPKFWEVTKRRYERLDELEFMNLHPHFVYYGHNLDVDYPPEFYKFFRFMAGPKVKEHQLTTTEGERIMSDFEIFDLGLNKFQGWKCWHNNYEIMADGRISNQCFGERSMEIPVDYFKDITEVKPRICPFEYCSCDGLLKQRKERE